MNSLNFLMLRQAKNRLLELKTKPAKLILFIVAIGIMAWMLVPGLTMEAPYSPVNINVFTGILAGFFMFSFVIYMMQGFVNGAAIFGMDDVNYLFVAPIKPRTVLLYGIIKMGKTLLLSSWFIIFQVQWMRGNFGIGIGGILFAALGYVLLCLVAQIMALFIYAFTNSRPHRKLAAKIILVAVFIPAAAVFILQFAQGTGLSYALTALLDSPVLSFTPIVGWAAAGVSAILFGEMMAGLFFLGLLTASGAFFFGAVYLGSPDYYEDVLGASETAFEAARTAKEDLTTAVTSTTRDIKIRGTGLSGIGAKVFFYKHVREAFRANRFGLWGIGSLLIVGGAVIWAFFGRQVYDGADASANSAEIWMLTLLGVLMMLKITLQGFCRGLLETYSHYIYMVPDRPFAKWFWANIESVFKAAVEAIVIFVAVGPIMGLPFITTLSAMVTLILFTFYLLGISMASMRITGTHLNTGLLLVIYFAVVIIPLIPGIVVAVVVGVLAPESLAIAFGLFALSAWMLLVGVLCFAISKGALHNTDMPVVKEFGMQ